jgi:hypothetical protein
VLAMAESDKDANLNLGLMDDWTLATPFDEPTAVPGAHAIERVVISVGVFVIQHVYCTCYSHINIIFHIDIGWVNKFSLFLSTSSCVM